MPDPQWENLKETFHAAVALPLKERAAYLDRVCDGNQSLRQAVESLLRSHEESNFVDAPAFEAAADMLADGVEVRPGQVVAHYQILSLLGQGGMGKVYLAADTKLQRRVAIKFLPAQPFVDEQANKRLLREAQAAAKLDHPNICAVHEVGEKDGCGFIVMPYIAGETLDARLNKPLAVSESVAIAAHVADALAEAHEQGIIHRDIKPANIIITPRGQPKVMDFGLAKTSAAIGAAEGLRIDTEASTQALLTTPGTIIGTVPYMSPEQVHCQPLDARTDIFSFGAVLYEMLTGKKPFAAESPAGIISAILTKEPAPLDQYIVGCPPDLQRIVSKCLEKNRERRYGAIREVVDDLENVQHECTGLRHARSLRERKTQPLETDASQLRPLVKGSFITGRRIVGLAAIVLALTALSVYALFLKKSSGGSTANLKSGNSSAYDLYLRGRVKNKDNNREAIESAVKLLEQAVQADPTFAPAYAELARAYGSKVDFFATDAERKKLNEDAKWAVEKSLALNPNLAEGHLVRGYLLWNRDNGYPHELAIQSYRRAISLDSTLPQAHHWLGVVYLHIGLLDKAEEEINRALALDPSDNLARFRLGAINVYRGKYEEAIQMLQQVPADAHPPLVYRSRAHALFALGKNEEARQLADDYLKMYSDEGGNVTSIKAMLLARSGRDTEAQETIARAIEIGKSFQHFHHTTYNIATAYALLNKPDEALKWLRFTADDGFPCYPLFENDANLNSLRKDVRFVAFMTELKQRWERYKSTL